MDSLIRQQEAVTKYAKRQGITIAAEFFDAAVSGADHIGEPPGRNDRSNQSGHWPRAWPERSGYAVPLPSCLRRLRKWPLFATRTQHGDGTVTGIHALGDLRNKEKRWADDEARADQDRRKRDGWTLFHFDFKPSFTIRNLTVPALND